MGNEEMARILVVDDEGAIRYSITKTLQRVGYQVESAASGEEALDLLEKQEFDVVLTDIRMPGISGVDLLARIKEKTGDTSVILMTGYASLNSAVESLRLGAHDYLVKPSSSRDIRDSVARGLERARNMRRRRNLLKMIQTTVDELAEEEPAETPRTPTTNVNLADDEMEVPQPVKGQLAVMELGPLTLYPGRYQITLDDEAIDLTPTEFDLLLYLAAHRGRIVPCSELVREVRGYAIDEAEAREVIRPHVSNLRRKIKASTRNLDLLVNVRGIGYRLSDFD